MTSRLWPVFGVLLSCIACGSLFAPRPTSRPVGMKDLVGTWKYQPTCSSSNAEVLITLSADGTFAQEVKADGQSLKQSGRWSVVGSEVRFTQVLSEFGGWKAGDHAWTIIDDLDDRSRFSILGGDDDPDCAPEIGPRIVIST